MGEFNRSLNGNNRRTSGTMKPSGFRTRPVFYNRGVSGKQSATRYPRNVSRKPLLLLVMDSNGRNIVRPEIVNPSPNVSFDFAAISIPGGKTFHACTELRHLPRCHHKVSHVVLALGTNDMFEGMPVLRQFRTRVENLIGVAEAVYPGAKISYASIIPRHDEHAAVVSEANAIIREVTEDYGIKFIKIKVPSRPDYWSDLIHMSDEGLRKFMQSFESQVEDKIFNNKEFKPEEEMSHRRNSSFFGRNDGYDDKYARKRKSPDFSSNLHGGKRMSLGTTSKEFNETWPRLRNTRSPIRFKSRSPIRDRSRSSMRYKLNSSRHERSNSPMRKSPQSLKHNTSRSSKHNTSKSSGHGRSKSPKHKKPRSPKHEEFKSSKRSIIRSRSNSESSEVSDDTISSSSYTSSSPEVRGQTRRIFIRSSPDKHKSDQKDSSSRLAQSFKSEKKVWMKSKINKIPRNIEREESLESSRQKEYPGLFKGPTDRIFSTSSETADDETDHASQCSLSIHKKKRPAGLDSDECFTPVKSSRKVSAPAESWTEIRQKFDNSLNESTDLNNSNISDTREIVCTTSCGHNIAQKTTHRVISKTGTKEKSNQVHKISGTKMQNVSLSGSIKKESLSDQRVVTSNSGSQESKTKLKIKSPTKRRQRVKSVGLQDRFVKNVLDSHLRGSTSQSSHNT
ncbi:uncharacterized protein LOC120336527 [Styela clava]